MTDSGHVAFIGMGTNLGDQRAYLRAALDAMDAWPHSAVTACSPLYRTAPVGYADQDWFLNRVARIRTALEPETLLTALQEVERSQGRERTGPRFGPRTLDLDILLFDDRILDIEALAIPHPRMDKRRFVLQPLCDIDATVRHPALGVPVGELLARLDPDDQPAERLEEGIS